MSGRLPVLALCLLPSCAALRAQLLRPVHVAHAPGSPGSGAKHLRAPVPRLLLDGVQHSGTAAFAAAFAASVVATVALHPMDTLKTRQQAAATADAGVWRGLSANVLKEAPDAAVFLAISEQLSQMLSQQPWFATHITMTLLLAGAAGDAVGSVFRLPAEVLCKRLQTDSGLCWHDALQGTSRQSWLAAWEAILFRDVPMGGLQIAAYRHAHVHLAPVLASIAAAVGASVPDSLSDCLAGLLAGACAAALTTPLDVLVTHAATSRPEADGARPRGPMQIGAELVRAEGPLSLTRGFGARTVYYAWVCGCFFGLYEAFRRALEAHGF